MHNVSFPRFPYFVGGTQDVIISIIVNWSGEPSSNSGRAVYISYSVNIHGKGMDLVISPPAMGKIVE